MLTLEDGLVSESFYGGAIVNRGTLSVRKTLLRDNRAFIGGAIANLGGILSIQNSHFEMNVAQAGGAIENGGNSGDESVTIIDGSTFIGNTGAYSGGALHNRSRLTVTSSRFTGNSSVYERGSVLDSTINSGVNNTMTGNCIAGNTAPAVRIDSSTNDVTGNWWGTSGGPYSYGDTVFGAVNAEPFLTSGILDCPTATNYTLYTPYLQPISFTAGATGGTAPYTFTLDRSWLGGNVSQTGTTFTYTPEVGYVAENYLIYKVTDANGVVGFGLVWINVFGELVAIDELITTTPNTPIGFELQTNGGRYPHIYEVLIPFTNGTVSGVAPNALIYTPDADYEGVDTLTFSVTDTNGITDTGTITVTVAGLTANAQTISTPLNTPVDFQLTASGGVQPYTFAVYSDSLASGTAFIIGNTVTFIPSYGFSGAVTIPFVVNDASGLIALGTITVQVQPQVGHVIAVNTVAYEYPAIRNGNCTLGEAIQAANTNLSVDACTAGTAGQDIVTVPAGRISIPGRDNRISGEFGLMSLEESIIIRGAGRDISVLQGDATGNHSLFLIRTGISVVVEGVTIRNFSSVDILRRGGAIYNDGNLTVRYATFENNGAANDGGAIYNRQGSLTVIESVFVDNRTTFRGGAIWNNTNRPIILLHNAFQDNHSQEGRSVLSYGGGIAHFNCMTSVLSSEFLAGSSAPANRIDARYNWWGESGAATQGAAGNLDLLPTMTSRPPICELLESPFHVAAGDVYGLQTAIYLANMREAVTITLEGGVYNVIDPQGPLPPPTTYYAAFHPVVGNITIVGNGAVIEWAGINTETSRFFLVGGTLTLVDLTLRGGQARQGGAIAVYQEGTLNASNVIFENNHAVGQSLTEGGVIYVERGSVDITQSRFINNTSRYGGIIYGDRSVVRVIDSVFTGNSGGDNNAGITFLRGGADAVIQNNCFVGNNGTGVYADQSNNGGTIINAAMNWWGAVDGASGAGTGSGDPVGVNVIYEPYLTTPLPFCPPEPLIARDQAVELNEFVGSVALTLSAIDGVKPYTFTVTVPPAHGTLTGAPPNVLYTPDAGYLGTDSFTFSVTDAFGATDTAVASLTIITSNIIVTSTEQEVLPVDDGDCTLTEAILAANLDLPVDACAAGNGADIIELPAGATFTFSEFHNQMDGFNSIPSITSEIALVGNNATIERSTADGTPAFRFFYIAGGASLELIDLTFRNGRASMPNAISEENFGGAIHNEGTLILRRVTLEGNQADYGGAVSNNQVDGSLTVIDSLIRTNAANFGGGLWNCGSAAIVNSTFDANVANRGDAIDLLCDTLTITDSLLRNNGMSVNQRIHIDRVIFDNSSIDFDVFGRGYIRESCFLTASNALSTIYPNNRIDVIENWWGSASGPSGIADGYGSSILTPYPYMVEYEPFLTAPILGCATFPMLAIDKTFDVYYQEPIGFFLETIDSVEPLSYVVTKPPSYGTLTGVLPNIIYTPDAGFSGMDTLSVQVIDASGDIDVASFTFHVSTPLVALTQTYETLHETSVNFTLTAEGGIAPYTFEIIDPPTFGTIQNAALLTKRYVPNDDFTGIDTLTFRVTDAFGQTSTTIITFHVGASVSVDDQTMTAPSGTTTPVMLTASAGKPPYHFTFTQPEHGGVFTNDTYIAYVPQAGYTGADSFTYTVWDANGDSDTASVNITVVPAELLSANLIQNSTFAVGSDGWLPYDGVIYRVTNGVLEFFRLSDATSAVMLNYTEIPLMSGTPVELVFDLGNSSGVRKRVTVILHEYNFTDLQVCTFWLPANTPLQTYRIQTVTNTDWTNTTLSFYVSTADSVGWVQLDNVSVRQVPSLTGNLTRCYDALLPG
jgi:predicted outer membrane repeat protein